MAVDILGVVSSGWLTANVARIHNIVIVNSKLATLFVYTFLNNNRNHCFTLNYFSVKQSWSARLYWKQQDRARDRKLQLLDGVQDPLECSFILKQDLVDCLKSKYYFRKVASTEFYSFSINSSSRFVVFS